jgi:PPK2 family polyphosphate:nucleotide phosphotransferase
MRQTPPMKVDQYRLSPTTSVTLSKWSTNDTDGFDGKKQDSEPVLAELNTRLAELQGRLFAEGKRRVLVVLQGMDTSGKDGTIKHVFRNVNPLGVKVANFKRPNDTELAHDYLWRIHEHTPGTGHITIFNRSHYEDVLVVRVHDLVPREQWKQRYRHIREFERMLADEGTIVRKFFLHISKDEQKERLEERLSNPEKQWKFEHGDVDERKLWDDYQKAYETALSETSTNYAPWYIVPSDRKWYRNLVISQVLIDTLESLEMRYPEPEQGLENITIV